MILTVGHTKGGVGKSTLAIQIATYLRINGCENVFLVDGDSQKSSMVALTIRNNDPKDRYPKIACSSYTNGQELLSQVKLQKNVWEHIIIDVGATSSMGLTSALMVSDKLLIPISPRGFDLYALQDIQSVMNQAHSFGASFKAFACLSRSDTKGQGSNDEAIEYIKNYPDISYTGVAIADRKAVAVASAQGLSVFEYSPKDAKACNEINTLINTVFK